VISGNSPEKAGSFTSMDRRDAKTMVLTRCIIAWGVCSPGLPMPAAGRSVEKV